MEIKSQTKDKTVPRLLRARTDKYYLNREDYVIINYAFMH